MSLRIVGAGLGRTGTLSVKLALEHLGFGPCYHMVEVLANPASELPRWQQAVDGNPDWLSIFQGYGATVDYPACNFWRALADFFPHAKVLLTVRDADEWFESARATIFSKHMRGRVIGSPLEPLFETCIWAGHGRRVFDRALMTAEFRRHNNEVRQSIPAQRLLVYEVTEGWAPLCRFLGVPEPTQPFPHVNSRAEMQELLEAPLAARNASRALRWISTEIRERCWNQRVDG